MEPASPRVADDGALSPEAPVPGQGTTVADGSLMRFREGDRKVEVKWRSMVGREGAAMRLRGVEAAFPFVRDGRASTATITSDECLYQPQPQEASFRGNVHVRTDDGLELDTERLDYKADEGVARTDEAVRFRRGSQLGQRPRARLPVGGRDPRPEGRGQAAPGERGGAADGHRGGSGEGDAGRAPRGLRRRDRSCGKARASCTASGCRCSSTPIPTRSTGRRRSRTWTCGSARAPPCPACPPPRGARSACAAGSCRCSSGPGGSCWRRRRSTRPAWKSGPAGATSQERRLLETDLIHFRSTRRGG